jgi:hypothetical protein
VKITFEGRDWEFDPEAITLKQAVAMHMAYGFTVDGWLAALGETDPRALQCLWWLMLQQDGKVMPLKDADCKIIDLSVAFADATDGAEEEPEPDPTPPSPPSPPPAPASPAPASPPDTIPAFHVPQGGGRHTAYTPVI